MAKQADDEWKKNLKLPNADLRPKTEDVTKTKGHDFRDYFFKERVVNGDI
jgi:ATP-dependent RNA helicase DDX6/DHH1